MITSYSQAMDFLASAPPFIDKEAQSMNMLKLLDYFGCPNKKVKAIHVAGTNGKGSVCAYLNSILMDSGYNVGMFTSPYLVYFEERIRINNLLISKDDVVRYLSLIREASISLNINVSQFGYITIMMFMYFADRAVDYAIIEVGLGGKFDPTNFCDPVVCVISSISLDHTALLGDSLELIAEQKAGIIKENIDVITAKQASEVEAVLSETCIRNNSRLHIVEAVSVECSINGTEFVFCNELYHTCMLGAHQAENASMAIKTAQILGIDQNCIKNAIKKTLWGGRLQIIDRNPLKIVDGAHNPDAAAKLVDFISTLNRKVILICAMVADKDIDSCVGYFSQIATKVFCVDINSPRNIGKAKLLHSFLNHGVNGECCDSIKEALNKAENISLTDNKEPAPVILICGSLYLVGEVLSLLEA